MGHVGYKVYSIPRRWNRLLKWENNLHIHTFNVKSGFDFGAYHNDFVFFRVGHRHNRGF
jgi:hypothetical protein